MNGMEWNGRVVVCARILIAAQIPSRDCLSHTKMIIKEMNNE